MRSQSLGGRGSGRRPPHRRPRPCRGARHDIPGVAWPKGRTSDRLFGLATVLDRRPHKSADTCRLPAERAGAGSAIGNASLLLTEREARDVAVISDIVERDRAFRMATAGPRPAGRSLGPVDPAGGCFIAGLERPCNRSGRSGGRPLGPATRGRGSAASGRSSSAYSAFLDRRVERDAGLRADAWTTSRLYLEMRTGGHGGDVARHHLDRAHAQGVRRRQ